MSGDYADDLYSQVYRERLAWVKKNPELVAEIFTDDWLTMLENEAEEKWIEQREACDPNFAELEYRIDGQSLESFLKSKLSPSIGEPDRDDQEMERD